MHFVSRLPQHQLVRPVSVPVKRKQQHQMIKEFWQLSMAPQSIIGWFALNYAKKAFSAFFLLYLTKFPLWK